MSIKETIGLGSTITTGNIITSTSLTPEDMHRLSTGNASYDSLVLQQFQTANTVRQLSKFPPVIKLSSNGLVKELPRGTTTVLDFVDLRHLIAEDGKVVSVPVGIAGREEVRYKYSSARQAWEIMLETTSEFEEAKPERLIVDTPKNVEDKLDAFKSTLKIK